MAEINAHGLIKPEPFVVKNMDGEECHYIISRFPATAAREIITQYPSTALPKIGEYVRNDELMLKLMSYVMRVRGESSVRLNSRALVENHVDDGETLMRIEHAMLEYNSSFLRSGGLSNFFDECLAMFLAKISAMSTPSSPPSSGPSSPPSENSGNTTT